MAFKKNINGHKRYVASKEPFVKFSGVHLNINVLAFYLLGEDTKQVDIYVNEEAEEVAIIPNEEGEYKIVKGAHINSVSNCSIIRIFKDLDTNQRYNVEKYENGIKFKIQRIQWKEEKDGRC